MFSRGSSTAGLGYEEGQTLYFAYGSNLGFDQMAKRCPQSRLVGRARLWSYRFHINERGFANVVKVRDSRAYVEGLCYRLTKTDEATLDRSEGVPNAYQKQETEVEFWPAPPKLLGRDVRDIARYRDALGLRSPWAHGSPIAAQSSSRRAVQQPSSAEAGADSKPARSREGRGTAARVMVYLSYKISRGLPWDEYIERMNVGLDDALQMGISPAYVWEEVKPQLAVGRGVRPSPAAQAPAPRKRQGVLAPASRNAPSVPAQNRASSIVPMAQRAAQSTVSSAQRRAQSMPTRRDVPSGQSPRGSQSESEARPVSSVVSHREVRRHRPTVGYTSHTSRSRRGRAKLSRSHAATGEPQASIRRDR